MKLRLVALVAASLLVLVGCGDDAATEGTDTPATGESTGASSSPSGEPDTAEDAVQYVALGDSYTAAPLVPEVDSADPCLRSSNNYPALVAAAMPELELTDVSCVGADSTAMIGVQQIGSDVNPAQFDALTPEVDLVTIGLGGNDFGLFESLLRDCASSSDIVDGQPCTDAATGGATEDLTAVIPKVSERMTAVLTGVAANAPDARIVVVGYPQLLPATGTCPELPVATGDYDYVRSLNVGLNEQLKIAAEASGADFVDMYAASEGHDICADEPWVNGKDTDPAAALAFHPFAVEQEAAAGLIVELLKS